MNFLRPMSFMLGALACFSAGTQAVSVDTPQAKKVVRVKYMASRVWTTGQPGGFSRLIEGVYAPEGQRVEYADGDVYLNDSKTGKDYILRTDKKIAECYPAASELQSETKEDSALTEQFKSVGASFLQKPKTTTRKAELRGYPCTVTETEVSAVGVRVRTEWWDTEIGGHPITLRAVTQSFNGDTLEDMTSSEAAQIDFLPQTPPDLLAIPREYKKVNIDKRDLRVTAKRMFSEMWKALTKP